MGLTSASFNNFRSRVDAALRDVFPVTLILPDGRQHSASGVGGKAMSDFMEGGEKKHFSFPFRAQFLTGWNPQMGDSLEWLLPNGSQIRMEITEVSIRPHESMHHLQCRYRKP